MSKFSLQTIREKENGNKITRNVRNTFWAIQAGATRLNRARIMCPVQLVTCVVLNAKY